jgi:hypothetical protein
MTTKNQVEQQLRTSWDLPETTKHLQHVVQEIEKCVPGERTKELMYELVCMVMECGERLHELETRMATGNIVEDNAKREERYRVELQQAKRKGEEGTNAYYHHDPADVKNWRG